MEELKEKLTAKDFNTEVNFLSKYGRVYPGICIQPESTKKEKRTVTRYARLFELKLYYFDSGSIEMYMDNIEKIEDIIEESGINRKAINLSVITRFIDSDEDTIAEMTIRGEIR